jgi:hypothetical protein
MRGAVVASVGTASDALGRTYRLLRYRLNKKYPTVTHSKKDE